MDTIAKETTPVSLEEEMRSSYLDYAMSVIVGRALPDVRDGLKPVHRRVLYAMSELGNDWNKPYKKSARIVGDVIGKYHPHGDTPIYDTIVRLAQDFSLRYCLVDGQGNFGSVDGDNAAAMRYTEVRMSKIGHTLLEDIERNTVDFLPNYDGSEREPSVLPAVIPNLLINGSSGIAVGMATNIPPHRLTEVLAACVHYLDHPQCTVQDLIRYIPAPDFPTAGLIYGVSGIYQAYETGRGRVVIRAKVHEEAVKDKVGQRKALIIDELPYQVNKKQLLEKIADLVNTKKMDGISDIRDESDKDGIRVVIELKRGENPDIVLNNLYKFTSMQYSFGMNMVALVDGQPRLLNLLEIIHYFIEHRRTIVYRAVLFDLQKAKERCHILEGFAVALASIDPIIALIKASASRQVAQQALLDQVWPADLVRAMLARVDVDTAWQRDSEEGGFVEGGYRFSAIQVKSILDMQLSRLTALEQEKIWTEYAKMVAAILDYQAILGDPARIDDILKEQFTRIQKDFGDPRRSEIVTTTADLSLEDLLSPHDMVVTFSHAGYIKSQPLSEYRSQKRGGRGKLAASTKDQDCINYLFIANTHDLILCFSSLGRCYWVKVYDVPQGSRTSRGRPIVNLFELRENETITAMLSVKDFAVEGQYILMATARGIMKKTALQEFANPRKGGIIAISLDDDDYLIAALLTNGSSDVMLFSNAGKAVRFSEADVREMGRTARGVRGMQMDDTNRVVSMLVSNAASPLSVLTVTENGYGKRTHIEEYTRHGRGTKGMIAINQSERNGCVVGAALVSADDEVMLITELGVLIRVKVQEIREMSRSTQGVLLINLDKGDRLAGVQKIIETVGEDEDEDE